MTAYRIILPKGCETYSANDEAEALEEAKTHTTPYNGYSEHEIACVLNQSNEPIAFYFNGVKYLAQKAE